MGSTLIGEPLGKLRGYVEIDRISVPLSNGEVVSVFRMSKSAL